MAKKFTLPLLFGLCALTTSNGFYLPGLAPVNYCHVGEQSDTCKSEIKLYVNRLNTEQSVIPYEYNHFDFCPANNDQSPVENLGQVVFGERIRLSPYKLEFMNNETCKLLCTKTYSGGDEQSAKKLQLLKKGMALNYQHHWIVDNMPVTWCYPLESSRQYCSTGFPMGCLSKEVRSPTDMCNIGYNQPNTYYLFNHVDLTITYHSGDKEEWGSGYRQKVGRIISVKVEPRSINHNPSLPDCDSRSPLAIKREDLSPSEKLDVLYTYRITYLIESGEDAQEEFGWKLVHGDVFRPPRKGMLLSVLLGSGIQVFFMALITLAFACLGFLSPANRGALMTCAMVLYVCLGTPAGYVSARVYKSFGGEKWKSNVLLTSMLSPGIVFSLFFVMNLIFWMNDSSAAVPFSTLVALLALWFGVSVPLTFVGSYFGFRKRPLEHPVRTNQIPRQIPEQSFYTQAVPGVVMGGVLPFGCIFIQLFFLLNSLWSSQVYYMFGFLFLVFLILVITCSETTILLCYFHLCAEDYHWWWRSFLTSGFTAFYLLVYCIHYFVTKLNIEDATSTFLYFGYTLIMVFLFFLLTGSIGFFACFWFVRKIYSVVKVD
ncbi:transmembrane 9 superfamily member 2 isoform X4 [Neodiprion pinetum]|uniref:Transmembrane 9 superfamily member n=1 Tax=Neodiprion lecontei TaxID=441921 RepID=A0ABM3G9B6_NEOLC|nr:transmembrane 9 superfamily member 2 isoform X3 [Neodiprion pinetum]XP_046596869.1 transmembrane 9 superfamily member 2 isoform X3 [Neodiprion lecontei]